MEFAINKADLVRELNLSQGVVEKKTTIPILSNVLIEADGDRIVLTATDLELGVRCSAPAIVKKGGSGTIPAKKLLDYVRLLPDGEINIKFADTHWATITCGRSKTRIAGMSRESFPELPHLPEVLAEIPVKTLAMMISKTIFAISAEESRFTLNGALLIVRADGMVMVATDSHRLALVEQKVQLGNLKAPYRALLPRKAMNEILKLAADAEPDAKLMFSGDDNHLFFTLGQRLLISRKLTGNFPEFERVLPKEHAHAVSMDRDELKGALERVMQFADERSRAIKLTAAANEFKLHSSLSETGESEETLTVSYDGPPVQIGFNAQYIVDFLRATAETEVVFHFKDGGAAGEMRPGGDAAYTYRYIIMPMRI